MSIKLTLQGLLIYLTMICYAAGFVVSMVKQERTGKKLFAAGFGIACIAFIYRFYTVGHWPMQNLFEVFLSLGLLIYPVSWLCEEKMGVRGGITDMLLGVIILFPAGFIFNADPQHLPPALQSWLFAPHVTVYMFSYLLMAKSAVQAVYQLKAAGNTPESSEYEKSTCRMILAGFPFLTLGLLLGSWWAKIAWSAYWSWDPKELWSLVSWLVYTGYFHFRYLYGQKYARTNSLIAVCGMAAIIITLLWVNLSKIFTGLHNYAS